LNSWKKFVKQVNELSSKEFGVSDGEDMLNALVYIQRRYETAIEFKKWLAPAKVKLASLPVFDANTAKRLFGIG